MDLVAQNMYATETFRKFNRLGGCKEVAEEILKENKNYAIACFALSAILLSYRYVTVDECNPWDERNKRSKEYSNKNYERFLEIFKEYSGMDVKIVLCEEQGLPFTRSAKNFLQFKGSDYEGWIYQFQNEHPTIIQSYFRGMVAALHKELGIPDEGFPMI